MMASEVNLCIYSSSPQLSELPDNEPQSPGSARVEALLLTEDSPSSSPQPQPLASTSGRPACFVITHSVSKKHNVGTIARCATAFGVKEVCLVGTRAYNSFGAHGAEAHVAFRHFSKLDECCRVLREQEGCTIVGIEIADGARPVQDHPFSGPTAFMLGNEGAGLSPKQLSLCDSLVYIPQYGVGTASLNVAVAASIILHHFALWAGYAERGREGAKFVVAEKPLRTTARGMVSDETPDQLRAARQERRQQNDAAADEAGPPDEGTLADAAGGGAAPLCGYGLAAEMVAGEGGLWGAGGGFGLGTGGAGEVDSLSTASSESLDSSHEVGLSPQALRPAAVAAAAGAVAGVVAPEPALDAVTDPNHDLEGDR